MLPPNCVNKAVLDTIVYSLKNNRVSSDRCYSIMCGSAGVLQNLIFLSYLQETLSMTYAEGSQSESSMNDSDRGKVERSSEPLSTSMRLRDNFKLKLIGLSIPIA